VAGNIGSALLSTRQTTSFEIGVELVKEAADDGASDLQSVLCNWN
jgi:hypothetical protein